ncbi:helix-turn-helix transcriptional regulator [Colwellia sp. MEBiC06753]
MDSLNTLTNLVYQGAIDGDFSPFLNELMITTNSNIGWLAMADQETLQPMFFDYKNTASGFNKEFFLNEYFYKLKELDPFWEVAKSLKELACIRGRDFLSKEQLHQADVYPIFEKAGVEYNLISFPIRSASLEAFIVLNRNKLKTEYSDYDLKLFSMIYPHVNRACFLYDKLARQKRQISLYQSVLENNPYPLIVIDEFQNLLQVNKVSSHILSKQNILVERNGKLVTKMASKNHLLKDFIRSTLDWIQAKIPEPVAITLENSQEQIMLKAYPITAESNLNDFNSPCCVIEILSTKQPQWQLFAEKFNISQKELRTVKLLFEGNDLQTAAELSHLSFNTIKSQLMSVYSKSGFNSQRELVAHLVNYI